MKLTNIPVIFEGVLQKANMEENPSPGYDDNRIGLDDLICIQCICRYNGIPISQASKGNWFKKSGVQNIGGKITMVKTHPRKTTFGLSYCQGVWEIEGSRNCGTSIKGTPSGQGEVSP